MLRSSCKFVILVEVKRNPGACFYGSILRRVLRNLRRSVAAVAPSHSAACCTVYTLYQAQERGEERAMGLFIIVRRGGRDGITDRPNLSRSIDAVIRALNFIRSAGRSVQHVPNVAFFATRRLPRLVVVGGGGGCTHHDTIRPCDRPDATAAGQKSDIFLPPIHARTGFSATSSPPHSIRTAAGYRGVCAPAPPRPSLPQQPASELGDATRRRARAALCCCNEFPFVCCKVRRTRHTSETMRESERLGERTEEPEAEGG